MNESKEIKDVVKARAIKGGTGYTSLYIRIPKKIAEALNIKEGDPLLIQAKDKNTIIIKKLIPA